MIDFVIAFLLMYVTGAIIYALGKADGVAYAVFIMQSKPGTMFSPRVFYLSILLWPFFAVLSLEQLWRCMDLSAKTAEKKEDD